MKLLFYAFFILSFGLTNVAFAQELPDFNAKAINKELDTIEKHLLMGKVSAQEIGDNLKQTNALQSEISQLKTSYSDKLQNVQKRLLAFGEEPKSGTKEVAEIALNRKKITAEEDEVKAKLAQIELINTKIDEINNLILKVRNQTLISKITLRQTSVFQLKEFAYSLWSFVSFIYDILKSPYVWYQNLDILQKQEVKTHGGEVGAIFMAIFALAVYLSVVIRRKFGYANCMENPSYAQKVRSSIAMGVSYGIIPAVLIFLFMVWLQDTKIINNGYIGTLLYLAAWYLLMFFIIQACIRGVFVPHCGNWRILRMGDKKACALSRACLYSALSVLSIEFLLELALATNAQNDTVYALQILAVIIKLVAILVIARRFFNNYEKQEPTAENNEMISNDAKNFLILMLLSCFLLLISLFGYVRLVEYVISRLMYSLIAIGLAWCVDKIVRWLVRKLLHSDFLAVGLNINLRFLVKVEFWFGVLFKPVLWAVTIIAILGLWGFSVDIMFHDIKNILLGFNIGGMHISIISLLSGICAFFVSLFIFKNLQRSIQTGQLSKVDMAEDSRNSLAAGIGLIGFIISLMVAFAVMGGSLSSIALIAGALSFGVGLGLQNIVSNFVSGIIIIFERPIKIGDWVIINGQEGIVKSINMRATQLEAFNKSDVIIPNSTILSGTLVNMTYSNRIGRVEIRIAVSLDNDVKYVKDSLLQLAETTPGILSNPAPSVSFSDIAGSILIFNLNCFTANVYNRQNIANIIRERILEEFTQKGIVLSGVKK